MLLGQHIYTGIMGIFEKRGIKKEIIAVIRPQSVLLYFFPDDQKKCYVRALILDHSQIKPKLKKEFSHVLLS